MTLYSTIETYLEKFYLPIDSGSLRLISDTNNPVYYFSSGHKKFIFKLVKDTEIELDFLKQCNDHLKKVVPVQNIIHIDQSLSDFPLPVVVAEYAEGQDVATILESNEYTQDFEDAFIEFLVLVTNAVNQIPPPAQGFGAYKTNRDLFRTFDESVNFSLNRYAHKFHQLLPESTDWKHVYQTMALCADMLIKPSTEDFCVVALDMNFKNFLWSKETGFTLINVPITGYTLRAMGIGETLSHLDGYAYTAFSGKIASLNPSQPELFFYQILYAETIGLLGSLSAAVGTSPEKIDSVLCWGYKANMKEKILRNINKLDKIITENY